MFSTTPPRATMIAVKPLLNSSVAQPQWNSLALNSVTACNKIVANVRNLKIFSQKLIFLIGTARWTNPTFLKKINGIMHLRVVPYWQKDANGKLYQTEESWMPLNF